MGSQVSSNVAMPSQSPKAPLVSSSRDSPLREAITSVPAAVKALRPSPVRSNRAEEPPRPQSTSRAEVPRAPANAAAGRNQARCQAASGAMPSSRAMPKRAPPKTPVSPGSASGLRKTPCCAAPPIPSARPAASAASTRGARNKAHAPPSPQPNPCAPTERAKATSATRPASPAKVARAGVINGPAR